jgi:hypothetical protein
VRAVTVATLRALVVVAAGACVACIPSTDALRDAAGGEFDGEDAGTEVPNVVDCDGGGCGASNSDACRALVRDACGADDAGARCATTPGCTAATLLATYEPDGCDDALTDDVRFPDCTDTTCALLVARVCGAAPPADDATCFDAPGCAPALQLWRRSIGVDAGGDPQDALASCGDALTDEDVFAPCG